MSNYTSLVDSLNKNPNMTKDQKEMLYKYFITIKEDIFDQYISDYDFSNSSFLIENVKLVSGGTDDIIHYDKDSNSLVIGKSPDNQAFNTYKSLIELVSQNYDESQNKVTSGLSVTIDGKKCGSKLNDLLTEYIITINTGMFSKNDMDESKINSKDVMVFCFEDMAGGAEKLMEYFTYGNGEKLYLEISQLLGEDNTRELYSDNVSVDRLLLSVQACKLKREQENNNTPKM